MSPQECRLSSPIYGRSPPAAGEGMALRPVRPLAKRSPPIEGESLCCFPPSRFGVPQGEKLRAAGDLKQSPTNRAAQALRPISPRTWDPFSSAVRSPMAT